MAEVNLSTFSDEELSTLIPKIEHELNRRQEEKKRAVLQKMKELAAEIGTTPEALLREGRGAAQHRQRRGKGKGKRYQHPDDPSKTWAGRGPKPKWLEEFLAEGRTLEELED
jgi:DNA-binding protein H-NS